MQTTSSLYRTLRADPDALYEVQVLRGPIIYGPDRIRSVKLSWALFDGSGPQVGGNHAARCDLQLLEEKGSWPRMASFTLRVRLQSADGQQTSEWLPLGTYYTDERHPSYSGELSITAFDGMLLLEQPWTDKVQTLPTSWPITASAAAALLQEVTGVLLESGTVLDNSVPFVGLDTTATARQTWATIAAATGANLLISATGRIRLVPLKTDESAGSGAIAGIAIAGLAVAGRASSMDTAAVHLLGLSVRSFDPGEPVPAISGVELQTDSGGIAKAGTTTGYVLKAACNFSDSVAADLCLQAAESYVYRPFSAAGVELDPAAELGDLVRLDDTLYPLVAITWTIGPKIFADLEAPAETEVDHEYSAPSEASRALRAALAADEAMVARTYSAFEQRADAILLTVGETYATKEEAEALQDEINDNEAETESRIAAVESQIVQTKNSLEVSISTVRQEANAGYNEVRQYIRYADGYVKLGESDSPSAFQVSHQDAALLWNGEPTTVWDQNRFLAPKKVEIPEGGSLQLGRILLQPRSSGNLSFLWVGGS